MRVERVGVGEGVRVVKVVTEGGKVKVGREGVGEVEGPAQAAVTCEHGLCR